MNRVCWCPRCYLIPLQQPEWVNSPPTGAGDDFRHALAPFETNRTYSFYLAAPSSSIRVQKFHSLVVQENTPS